MQQFLMGKDFWILSIFVVAAVVFAFGCGFLAGRARKRRQASNLAAPGPVILGKHEPDIKSDGSVHEWFELSYAQYVALPRSILQSMPRSWQNLFVTLMDLLDQEFDWRRPGCWVRYQDRHGKFMHDELADYDRGRRFLTREEVAEITARHKKAYDR